MPNNYERIKEIGVKKAAMMVALFVWESLCECDAVQQMKCERFDCMPEGGCLECITKDAEEWLESECDCDAE